MLFLVDESPAPLVGFDFLLSLDPSVVMDLNFISVLAFLYVFLLMKYLSLYNHIQVSTRQYASLCGIDGDKIIKMPFLWVGISCNRIKIYHRNGKNRGTNRIWEHTVIFCSIRFAQVQVGLSLARTKVPPFLGRP